MNRSFDTALLIRGLLSLFGLAVAVFFGVLIGEANWTLLSIIVSLVLLAAVAQFALRNLLAICLVLVTLDFYMSPTGFKISPMEQVGIVAAFAWLLVCWRRGFNPFAPTDFMDLRAWRLFQNTVLVAAAYAVGHFIYNMINPYDELAFGWRGASKAYSQTFGAFLMIVFLARGRLLFPIRATTSVALLRLFFGVLLIATAIGTTRAFLEGPEQETGLSLEEKSEATRLFLIPGLNAHDNVYTLRQLGPAAVLIGATFFFCRPSNLGPFLPFSIASLGFFASLVSAGRATFVFAAAFLAVAMLRAKRGPLAFAVAGIMAIIVSVILVLPGSTLRELPWHVQRSLGWFRPDLRTQATEGIEGSSDMRWRYFKFAWDHYTSGDARIILFGRSVGQMDSVDVLSFVLYNDLAQMEFAVRRLGTHNGLTDLLLGWGLFGYLFNVGMCVTCIALLLRYSALFARNSHGACWTFVAASFLAFWLIYTHVGGAFVWPLAIVFVLVALAQTDGLETTEPSRIAHEHRSKIPIV